MPTLADTLMARRMWKPGVTLRWAFGQWLCVWEAVWLLLPYPCVGAVSGAGGGWGREFPPKGLGRRVPGV